MNYIYKITNMVNKKVYIGKTSSTIEERFREHIRTSKNKNAQGRPIYLAFRKYGIENFSIEEIECVETDEIASERESYWIRQYHSYVGFKDARGYNATLGGDGKAYLDLNEDEILMEYNKCNSAYIIANKHHVSTNTVYRILKKYDIERKNEKEIVMIRNNKIIKKFKSQVEANLYFNKDPESRCIGNVLKHRAKTAYGYEWKFLTEFMATG